MKKLLTFCLLLTFLAAGQISATEKYAPIINSDDFSSDIEGNKYFHLPVGTILKFEKETKEGLEQITIEILNEKVDVNGVQTRVYLDTVYLDGQIREQTRDYIAQHKKTGDIWYFGEDVNNYEEGKLVDHEGAWLYGKDGALPGIWIKANPQIGEIYLQEYLEGKAEDRVEILSLSETVNVNGKTYENCLKTYDYTLLDDHSKEHKYYCPEIGNLVYVEHLVDDEFLNLISAEKPGNVKNNFSQNLTDSDLEKDDYEENKEVLSIIGAGLIGFLIGGLAVFLWRRKQK